MTAVPVSSGVRAVLDAPRGRRFSRPGASAPPISPIREQRLLAQMEGNPRVAYRQAHGVLPAWMEIHAARLAERDTRAPEGPEERPRRPAAPPVRPPEPAVPRPRPAPDDSPFPSRRERPPLPRRRSKRPHGHRKPRSWFRTGRPDRPGPVRLLTAYTLAISTGALAHHLATVLL
ncbi:hypothetical protein [Nocardiopsis sp. RV163]|uniref:hypothetical protein n=1 Tax=Nocardiopsis sp. RV163 TaxID=1661388 RepID=UPI00069DB889|nr:hypothetical protein [Nocardiopsis sp. RV163]